MQYKGYGLKEVRIFDCPDNLGMGFNVIAPSQRQKEVIEAVNYNSTMFLNLRTALQAIDVAEKAGK